MKRMYFKLTAVSAAVIAAVGTAYVVAEPAVELEPGDTITVTGLAPADVLVPDCTVVDAALGQVMCPSLRAAVIYANNNGNQATKYDKIVLDNGSVHTLDVPRALGELIQAQFSDEDPIALEAFDAAGGDLDITGPVNIETVDPLGDKATIQGADGFNDRLLHINAKVTLTNLVLTKGQALYMNGGAIYAEGAANTTITRSLITGNFAEWDGNYGEPLVDGDGTTEFQGSGGGIYTKGPLTISLSTLSNNDAETYVEGGEFDYQKNGNGGAIYASQTLLITDSTLGGEGVGNKAINGGAIQLAGGKAVTIERTTVSHNLAVSGGGLNRVSPAVTLTVVNSTFSANRATDAGGGLNINGSATIINSTIANNLQDSGGPDATKGAGVNQFNDGNVTLVNTLLANNLADLETKSANCGKTGVGVAVITSGGGNLSTDDTCNLTPPVDQVVDNAKIGPLALNGNIISANLTHALLTGSPAIDKGTAAQCPAIDERGVVRPQAGLVQDVKVCDVGAFELVVDFPAPSDDDDGGGCTVGGNGRFDPTLPALAAAGLVFFGLRRFKASK